MTAEKNLNALGILIHRGVLIDWKILEVGDLFYICPSPIGFSALHDGSLELNSIAMTLRGERNVHVLSRVLPNADCFLVNFKEMLTAASELEWKGHKGIGIPLVWDNAVNPEALGFNGYLTIDDYLTPYNSLGVVEKYLKTLEPDLLLNSTKSYHSPETITTLTHFKTWLLRLKSEHGVQALSDVTGVSVTQLSRVIKSGKIHYPVAVKLKQVYPDNDLVLFDKLIQRNSLEYDTTIVDYNHRKFSANLRALRIFSGLTQKGVLTLGVSLQCVGSVEHGKRKISMAELDELVLLYRIHGAPIRSQYTDYYNELIKETYKTFRLHLKDRGEYEK